VNDIVIVGAGAAGLAAAIFAKRARPGLRIVLLDGAKTPGAKFLVSGGGRCNVTNVTVTASDFNGGRPGSIRQILRAWPASATVDFFRALGVTLHEEADGKLFPDSHRSRDVLDALLGEVRRLGVEMRSDCRVTDIAPAAAGFALETSGGSVESAVVVLATGGLALPKTGSDGLGYGFAQQLGHTIIPTTPALVPLLVDAAAPLQFHSEVSGVSQIVRLTVHVAGRAATHVDGSLLWTHFGISGPAALDISRHWLRHELEGRAPQLSANLVPDSPFEALEARWLELSARQPRTTVSKAISTMIPASVAEAIGRQLDIEPDQTLAGFTRDDRRLLIHRLLEWPIAVTGSRGYTFAEVTAGGVPLTEIDPKTMASRVCPGLFLVGEVLDVDGRLGGFNFQWAWSTAKVAGDAAAARIS
jgi:predicted Rossmann fold flavoprotein